LIGTLQVTYCCSTCKDIVVIVKLSELGQKYDVMNKNLQVKG